MDLRRRCAGLRCRCASGLRPRAVAPLQRAGDRVGSRAVCLALRPLSGAFAAVPLGGAGAGAGLPGERRACRCALPHGPDGCGLWRPWHGLPARRPAARRCAEDRGCGGCRLRWNCPAVGEGTTTRAGWRVAGGGRRDRLARSAPRSLAAPASLALQGVEPRAHSTRRQDRSGAPRPARLARCGGESDRAVPPRAGPQLDGARRPAGSDRALHRRWRPHRDHPCQRRPALSGGRDRRAPLPHVGEPAAGAGAGCRRRGRGVAGAAPWRTRGRCGGAEPGRARHRARGARRTRRGPRGRARMSACMWRTHAASPRARPNGGT